MNRTILIDDWCLWEAAILLIHNINCEIYCILCFNKNSIYFELLCVIFYSRAIYPYEHKVYRIENNCNYFCVFVHVKLVNVWVTKFQWKLLKASSLFYHMQRCSKRYAMLCNKFWICQQIFVLLSFFVFNSLLFLCDLIQQDLLFSVKS